MRTFGWVALGLAGGCALFPLGEADCKVADWRQRGYEHGFAGALPQDMRLIPECRERFGLEIAREDYLAGWRDGYNEWDRIMGSTMRRNR
jgi:hypothetical protein